MENIIRIEAYGKDGLIDTIEMCLNDYYDGDIFDEIIEPENLVSKGIISLKGTQYGTEGKPYQIWQTFYDNDGNFVRDEMQDIDDD